MTRLPEMLSTPAGRVRAVLLFLVSLDVILSVWALAFPGLWFAVFHGTELADPQGLLPRTGASWAAFALIQAAAIIRWEKSPGWLLAVAGLRLGDCFTDWTYLAVAPDLTWFAYPALGMASPANLAAGIFLILAFRKHSAPSTFP